MVGPVDPSCIVPGAKLPKPKSFEQWRNRVVCRLLGRVAREDFDFAFETVVEWMDAGGGRIIDVRQAQLSAFDIILAMCGVTSSVCVQRCELTGTTLLTVQVIGTTDEPALSRTRRIEIRDPQAAPAPAELKQRKRA